MSVTEFIEYMRHKNRKNSTNNVQQSSTNNSVRNDMRSTSENQHINIFFITEEKLTTNVRRRYESQVNITISLT